MEIYSTPDFVDHTIGKWVSVIGSGLRKGEEPSELIHRMMNDSDFCAIAESILKRVKADGQSASIIRVAAKRSLLRTELDPTHLSNHPLYGRF